MLAVGVRAINGVKQRFVVRAVWRAVRAVALIIKVLQVFRGGVLVVTERERLRLIVLMVKTDFFTLIRQNIPALVGARIIQQRDIFI